MYGFMGLIVFYMLGSVALAASPLEETRWRVEITPKGSEIPHHIDRLRFENGKFTSVIFERKGFLTVPYTPTGKVGGPIAWEARQKSDTDGDLSWHGEVQGDAMKGTLVWKQPNGTVINHSFIGSRVKEEPLAPEATQPPAPKPKAKPRAK
jgi:hypothetical protein